MHIFQINILTFNFDVLYMFLPTRLLIPMHVKHTITLNVTHQLMHFQYNNILD